jgi:hypothetical protein
VEGGRQICDGDGAFYDIDFVTSDLTCVKS